MRHSGRPLSRQGIGDGLAGQGDQRGDSSGEIAICDL